MKISIKTLKGSSFEIEVEPSSTVADIKKLIETTQGQNVYPADRQLLIHHGKFLADETETLEENKVLENDFIVIMRSSSYIPEGMETEEWGGIDRETDERCRHGKRPRRLLCWDRKNTGRRYLGYLLRGKSNMCNFIEWKDDKCPPMFQEVAANIWEVADNFKETVNELEVDLSAEIQLRNEMDEEKEDWEREKEDRDREKEDLVKEQERLVRELTMRTNFVETICSTQKNRIRSYDYDKKMLYGFILCLLGLFAVILKNK